MKGVILIRKLKPSARSELETAGVSNAYLREGALRFEVFEGWSTDAGTFDSLHLVNELARAGAHIESEELTPASTS